MPLLSTGGLVTLSSLFGLSSVGIGAFGAHALAERLAAERPQAVWKTASTYHLVHSIAMLAGSLANAAIARCGGKPNKFLSRAVELWALGTTLFSGSLYLLALGHRGILGPVTPIGGVIMMCGWASAAVAGATMDN